MSVGLEELYVAAIGGRFIKLDGNRYLPADHFVNRFTAQRQLGTEISAEDIADLVDHGAVADFRAGTRGVCRGETPDTDTARGELSDKYVYRVSFTIDGHRLAEIYFDIDPEGRKPKGDRFVELFNRAVNEGYYR